MADERDIQRAIASLRLPKGMTARAVPKKKPTKRIGYRECIEYIGENDDESMIMAGDPSVVVSMVSHLFDKDEQVVIADVRRYLEKHDG